MIKKTRRIWERMLVLVIQSKNTFKPNEECLVVYHLHINSNSFPRETVKTKSMTIHNEPPEPYMIFISFDIIHQVHPIDSIKKTTFHFPQYLVRITGSHHWGPPGNNILPGFEWPWPNDITSSGFAMITDQTTQKNGRTPASPRNNSNLSIFQGWFFISHVTI